MCVYVRVSSDILSSTKIQRVHPALVRCIRFQPIVRPFIPSPFPALVEFPVSSTTTTYKPYDVHSFLVYSPPLSSSFLPLFLSPV